MISSLSGGNAFYARRHVYPVTDERGAEFITAGVAFECDEKGVQIFETPAPEDELVKKPKTKRSTAKKAVSKKSMEKETR